MSTFEDAKVRVEKNIGSLEHLCKEAICLADYQLMLAMGFPEEASKKLCELVVKNAKELGIRDLEKHFNNHIKYGKSNIINTIVRRTHKVYFASRSKMPPIQLLEHIENPGDEDICSSLYKKSLVDNHVSSKKRRTKMLAKKFICKKEQIKNINSIALAAYRRVMENND